MTKPNERTLKMMENFMDLHDAGYSVGEIAKKFDLSDSTVYGKLSEIAARAGVTRESLLDKPFEADHSGRNFTPVKPVAPTRFHSHFNATMTEIAAMKQDISGSIEELEIMNELLEEEISDDKNSSHS